MVRLGSEVLLRLPSSVPASPFVADPFTGSRGWSFCIWPMSRNTASFSIPTGIDVGHPAAEFSKRVPESQWESNQFSLPFSH